MQLGLVFTGVGAQNLLQQAEPLGLVARGGEQAGTCDMLALGRRGLLGAPPYQGPRRQREASLRSALLGERLFEY